MSICEDVWVCFYKVFRDLGVGALTAIFLGFSSLVDRWFGFGQGICLIEWYSINRWVALSCVAAIYGVVLTFKHHVSMYDALIIYLFQSMFLLMYVAYGGCGYGFSDLYSVFIWSLIFDCIAMFLIMRKIKRGDR